MASGQIVVFPLRILPPATSFAVPNIINGASSPAERYNVWQFADAAAAYIDYLCALKGYAGGGLTLRLGWSSLATANNAVWQAAIRRIADDADDMDTGAHTFDFNTSGAVTAPSASGEVVYDNITFTDGADMDSWADNEMAIVRLLRDPAHGSDNLANTAYLWGWYGYET